MGRMGLGWGRRAGGLATVVVACVVAASGLVVASPATAYTENFCGRLVDDSDFCKSSGFHGFKWISNTYPTTSGGTLYRLCVDGLTAAGHWKGPPRRHT